MKLKLKIFLFFDVNWTRPLIINNTVAAVLDLLKCFSFVVVVVVKVWTTTTTTAKWKNYHYFDNNRCCSVVVVVAPKNRNNPPTHFIYINIEKLESWTWIMTMMMLMMLPRIDRLKFHSNNDVDYCCCPVFVWEYNLQNLINRKLFIKILNLTSSSVSAAPLSVDFLKQNPELSKIESRFFW